MGQEASERIATMENESGKVERQIATSDTVTLKVGGPMMVVIDWEDSEPVCAWFEREPHPMVTAAYKNTCSVQDVERLKKMMQEAMGASYLLYPEGVDVKSIPSDPYYSGKFHRERFPAHCLVLKP